MANILIIDDDNLFVRSIKRILDDANHKVQIAPDGNAGIDMLGKSHIDLILMDMWMPELDGMTTFEMIKEAFPQHPPVVMMTGFGNIQLAVRFLKEGGADFIEKPIYNDEFMLRINRILKSQEVDNFLTATAQGQPEEKVSVLHAVNNIISNITPHIAIDIKVPKKLHVTANSHRLHIVLSHLIDNALKHAKTRIVITASKHKGSDTLIAISDDGEGIPADRIQKLFTLEHGTSLYISRKIIQLMGGDIGVESEIGKGTTFYFNLPEGGPR